MTGREVGRRVAVIGVAGTVGLGVSQGLGMAPAASAPGGEVGQILDQLQIQAVVDGIDDAVDAKDWDAALAYFTETVDVDFAALNGGPEGAVPAAELVGGWRQNLYAEKASFHQRTNHRIRIDGDTAAVISKGYAFNRLPRPFGDALWEIWAEYAHRLVRTEAGWRCSAIAIAKVLHARGNELAWTAPPES